MVTLLMIADDFTGALDAGVKFADSGAQVKVVADYNYDFRLTGEGVQVLVMDAETRHISGQEAYNRVYEIVRRARDGGIPYIFKKTDSALRGNIGSELSGMLDACKAKVLHFLPAFPQMGRTTEGGIQYIEGIPVSESVFGKDPFEPVTCSKIPDLIKKQSNRAVRVVTDGEIVSDVDEPTIAVYDAKSDQELKELAIRLKEADQLHVIGGCAGLAEAMPELLKLTGQVSDRSWIPGNLLVACGSVNPITRKQLDYAEQHGFLRFRLTTREKLETGYFESEEGLEKLKVLAKIIKENPRCILDTNDGSGNDDTAQYANALGISKEEMRVRISDTLGYLVKELIRQGVESTILITGGDSLLGFMKRIQVYEMIPLGEITPGTVLSQFEIDGMTYEVITKSGGFGSESLIADLAE